tara:strand:+ start:18581 stop:19903 length:1323 start_codon:yes stop_codon:yes gene_type:complete
LGNKEYSSKSIFSKAIFNVAFQVFPILVALILMPVLINNLGKDFWAKYTTGISIIFLSNYFSFGIGPTLNRRISELVGKKNHKKVGSEIEKCISLSYLLGGGFLAVFLVLLLAAYFTKAFSILQSPTDFLFYLITTTCFLVVLLTIPYRSTLEAFSDFYFLSVFRALSSSMLFLVPFVLWLFGFGTLTISAWCLLIFYLIIWILFYMRATKHKIEYGFSFARPFQRKLATGVVRPNRDFLSETLSFSIFFLCSATVLFLDRFYYALFFDTKLLSDHVTMLDLFNRAAIVTGTISLVYFSAISVWYNEENFLRIKKNLRFQFTVVAFLFTAIIIFSIFFLKDLMAWWLSESFSDFIANVSFPLLLGILLINFEILMIRPLQAIGQINKVNRWLVFSTSTYVAMILFIGFFELIYYHYIALVLKGSIDCIALFIMLKKEKLI